MTARSRIAAPCARISRSIASRSMAMCSASASVRPAARAALRRAQQEQQRCERRRRRAERFVEGTCTHSGKSQRAGATSRRRSDDAGSVALLQEPAETDGERRCAAAARARLSVAVAATSACVRRRRAARAAELAAPAGQRQASTRESTCGSCGIRSRRPGRASPRRGGGQYGQCSPGAIAMPSGMAPRTCRCRGTHGSIDAITHRAAAAAATSGRTTPARPGTGSVARLRNQWQACEFT